MSKFPVPSVIQCVPKRLNSARQVQQRLGSKLYLDLSGDGRYALLESLMTFGGRGHLHLEDDIILAKNFEQLVPPIINKHQDQIIRFFPSCFNHFSYVSVGKPYIAPNDKFQYLQCVWFPDWFPSQFLDWADEVGYPPPPERRYEKYGIYDLWVRAFLRHTKRDFICWYPSLVQHQVGESAVDSSRDIIRQSKFFIEETKWRYKKLSNGKLRAYKKK